MVKLTLAEETRSDRAVAVIRAGNHPEKGLGVEEILQGTSEKFGETEGAYLYSLDSDAFHATIEAYTEARFTNPTQISKMRFRGMGLNGDGTARGELLFEATGKCSADMQTQMAR